MTLCFMLNEFSLWRLLCQQYTPVIKMKYAAFELKLVRSARDLFPLQVFAKSITSLNFVQHRVDVF